MKLRLFPQALTSGLEIAARTTGNPKVQPILGNVLVSADQDGGVTITGTDLESRAWRRVTATVDEAGGITLPPATLAAFVKECAPETEIVLTTSISEGGQHSARLVCGRAQIRVPGLPPSDFPVAASFEDPSADLTLAAGTVTDVIGGVVHAAASDESRPVLAGVLVAMRDGSLTMAASDGFRLAVRRVAVDIDTDLSIIVPARTCSSILAPLKTATTARLVVADLHNGLLIDSEAGCWSSKLIDGQFPDFMRIVPRGSKCRVTVNRAGLLSAAKLVRSVKETDITRLSVRDGVVEIRAFDTSGDRQADVELDAEVDGDPLAVAINGQYFQEAIEALAGDRIELKLSGPTTPILLTGDAGQDNLQICMPMATKGAS
jgi:DNA polymerase-3 subunit beta